MKKIIILFSICVGFAFVSCKTQEDALKTTPVVVEEPKSPYSSIPAFQGTILGNEVSYQDKVDFWRTLISFESKYTFEGINVVPVFINPRIAFESVEDGTLNDTKSLTIAFPSITTLKEMNDKEHIKKNVLALGQKKLMYNPTIQIVSPHQGFQVFYYERTKNKVVYGGTKWNEQPADALEIVSVKEQKPPHPDFVTTFMVTFKINCKLYDNDSNYKGDVKGLLTCRWDYRLQ